MGVTRSMVVPESMVSDVNGLIPSRHTWSQRGSKGSSECSGGDVRGVMRAWEVADELGIGWCGLRMIRPGKWLLHRDRPGGLRDGIGGLGRGR